MTGLCFSIEIIMRAYCRIFCRVWDGTPVDCRKEPSVLNFVGDFVLLCLADCFCQETHELSESRRGDAAVTYIVSSLIFLNLAESAKIAARPTMNLISRGELNVPDFL